MYSVEACVGCYVYSLSVVIARGQVLAAACQSIQRLSDSGCDFAFGGFLATLDIEPVRGMFEP